MVAAVLALLLSGVVPYQPALTFRLPTHRFDGLIPQQSTASDVVSAPPKKASRKATRRPERHVKRHVTVPLSAATTVLAYPPPPIQARAAFLEDMQTGQVLFEQNADERLPMASTTKITTAVVALQRSRLTDLVTVSARAASIGESTMALRRGERLSVLNLLYGLLLNSGNDAAIALAEHAAGSVQRFVAMMNQLARSLHMRNTHYVTPHGLDTPGHYSSARDLATIARYAMRDPTFRRIVDTSSFHIPATKHNQEHWLASINKVIYWFPGVDGVKPGDTDAAGLCQVVSDWRNGRHLLAVLLNTPTLIFDIRNLLDYGSQDFSWAQAPVWGDGPTDSLAGGSGKSSWLYYFGAGHYIRGLYLAYFKSHGGLSSLGYPRTEPISVGGRMIQYFQAGALAYDPTHHSVYPVDLGRTQAERFAARELRDRESPRIAGQFAAFYKRIGGHGVLGEPVTGQTTVNGVPAQFFQYGELAWINGAAHIVPVGDADLRLRGWLPAGGASDQFPPTLAPSVVMRISPPRPPAHHEIVIQVRPPHPVPVAAVRDSSGKAGGGS